MSTIIPADFPVEEEDSAKAQAGAQYASIAAMVAAMKCDYDRLEELRDEKEGATRYVAGWNMPGYNPDDVATFDDSIDAMQYIQGAALDVYVDDDEISAEQLDAIRGEIDTWKADENGEFGHTYRKYHYFVIQQTSDDVFTAEDAEELAELEEAAGEYEDQDAARDAIREDPLSVEVRSDLSLHRGVAHGRAGGGEMSYKRMLAAGYTWAVVVAYDGPYGDKGSVISKHKSYAAAERAVNNAGPGGASNWLAIKDVKACAATEAGKT